MSLFDASDEIESVLFVQREMSGQQSYILAAEWGLENPLWKGRLRVLEKESTGVVIVLEDGQTGAPFARAPYTDDSAVQPVLDSSRYFVLRVQDPNTGNKAHIGIGFTDRAESFDFTVHFKLTVILRRKEAPAKLEESAVPSRPKVDYSLKEGQTFKISILGGKAASSSNASSSTTASSGGAIPLLPPPPGGGRRP
ncbi:13381_t:CDS:2 [Acaulospora colombiana]|uniref:13381_t:CDS:1 n=1 Tax=Acaulospora colombiana TaxID=27376 RepID=A0ACA9MZB9_9GLOM|nr:13381_t:CDS:2 [Acaulospora colombiana]